MLRLLHSFIVAHTNLPLQQQSPYNTNKQRVVSNRDDDFAPDSASAEYDPFVQYSWLSQDVKGMSLHFPVINLSNHSYRWTFGMDSPRRQQLRLHCVAAIPKAERVQRPS